MQHSFRSISAALIAVAIISLEFSGASASDVPVEPPPTDTLVVDPGGGEVTAAVEPAAAAAMAESLGISVAEATARLGRQQRLGDQGAALEANLGGRTGGSYLDVDGNLVVTTLDPAGDKAAIKGGARAQRVDDNTARLENIMRRLDKQAAQSGAGGLQGWFVDVPSNTVVVTVTEGAVDPKTQKMLKLAATFGASVRIEYAPASAAPAETAEYLAGGMQVITPTGGTCSVGFNTVDASNRPVVLTAGHCVSIGSTISRNGYIIGATRTKNYPTDDFGTFWNSYPGYWIARPAVFTYNNAYMNVRGSWGNPPIGATVCKSGRTTGWTCGRITALNVTVSYRGGAVIGGLVKHNACVEPGDSGGANMSTGGYALGVTSGSNYDEASKLCQSKFGRVNVAYYQPIVEALNRNGLRLLVAA